MHVGKSDLDVGAGDQGIMFGYASDETSSCMPLTHLMATKLGHKLTEVRKDGSLWWLRPDGKTQVTIKYIQHTDGSVEPLMIHTVVISTQHAEPLKAKRTEEQDGKDNRPKYTGAEQIAPSMADMNELIHDQVIVATLNEITLKNGQPATSIYDRNTCNLHINPSGKFIIGGPQGDAGLTGRKIIIDTYGGWGAHGGGAFSGKDPTKVDRSAAYACRWMAKSVVKAGLCKRALVQLSYAIGVAKPLSLFPLVDALARGGEDDGLNWLPARRVAERRLARHEAAPAHGQVRPEVVGPRRRRRPPPRASACGTQCRTGCAGSCRATPSGSCPTQIVPDEPTPSAPSPGQDRRRDPSPRSATARSRRSAPSIACGAPPEHPRSTCNGSAPPKGCSPGRTSRRSRWRTRRRRRCSVSYTHLTLPTKA